MASKVFRRIAVITVVLAFGVAGVAEAATFATTSQRRTMLRTSGIGVQSGKPEGYVKWAVASTKGPYAVAFVTGGGRYHRSFQSGLTMLHRIGARWHLVALFEDESCRSVPAKVFTDLRRWFRGPGTHRIGRRQADGIAKLLSPAHPCEVIAHR